MPSLTEVGGRIRYSIERFDGGLNTNDSPSKIGPFDSPDCLNVVFDNAGSVWTRDGSKKFNTTTIGSLTVDHGITYNNQSVIWAGGKMWAASGTTFVPVTSSSGKFGVGSQVAAVVYQNVLFCSDGTNGPWKWTGSENFYNMGIDSPGPPSAASSGAGSLSTGTYYYAVSYVNSQVVEGQLGSASVAAVTTSSATVRLTGVPTGSSLAGVNQRFIYRAEAASGPFRKVGQINDNTTTTFDDTLANGAEGKFPILDGTKPTPFTTIDSLKERLFFDDSSNRSLLRYTNFTNPYISEALNVEPLDNGDGQNILAIAGQDDFLTAWKDNKSFSIFLQDPSDDLTWVKKEIPTNIGIVGPHAFAKVQDGIVFIGRQNYKITGAHFLSGLKVIETNDGKLRSLSISQRIEDNFFTGINSSFWSSIFCQSYQNRLFMAYPSTTSSTNDRIFWLDLNRMADQGQIGSWAPWSGINAKCLFVHNGLLYSGDSTSTGFVRQLMASQYSDSGSAINSYFWTKEIGGEEDGSLDGYIKDLREIYLWFARLGNYNMNLKYRLDGDTGDGTAYPVNLNPGGTTWGSMVWGVGKWGGTRSDSQLRIPIGRIIARRFQFRFDNQNTVNQAFKVHRLEIGMNLRRRR